MFGSGAIVLSVAKVKSSVFFSIEYVACESAVNSFDQIVLDSVTLPLLIDPVPKVRNIVWLNCKYNQPYFFSLSLKKREHFISD